MSFKILRLAKDGGKILLFFDQLIDFLIVTVETL